MCYGNTRDEACWFRYTGKGTPGTSREDVQVLRLCQAHRLLATPHANCVRESKGREAIMERVELLSPSTKDTLSLEYDLSRKLTVSAVLTDRQEQQLQDFIASHPEWGIAVEVMRTIAGGAIDVGDEAVNGNNDWAATTIVLGNPANATGTINHIELYLNRACTGLRVGSFFLVSGTTHECRASVNVGDVGAAGLATWDAPGDFTAFAITLGDYAGFFPTTGAIERSTTGYSGIRYATGEHIDTGDQMATSLAASQSISVYLTGVESGGASSKGAAMLLGLLI